jgi:hypothetical protein
MHVGHSITFSAYLWYFYVRGQYKSYAPYLKYIHRERFVQDIHFVHMYIALKWIHKKSFCLPHPFKKLPSAGHLFYSCSTYGLETVTFSMPCQRWYIFIPKILTWENFGSPWNRKGWYTLWPFGIFYHFVCFMSISLILWSFSLFFWVNFGGPWNRKGHILWPFGIHYVHLVYFTAIW